MAIFRVAALALIGAMLVISAHAEGAKPTADHAKFKELKGPFATGPDVTKACLSCHTEAAKQVQRTKHWTWEYMNPDTKQRLGKKNVINNFCTRSRRTISSVPPATSAMAGRTTNVRLLGEQKTSTAWCATTPPANIANTPDSPAIRSMSDTEYPPDSGKMARPVDLAKVRAERRQDQPSRPAAPATSTAAAAMR